MMHLGISSINSSSDLHTQVAFQNFQPNYFASPEKKNGDVMIESATSNYTVNEDLSVTIKMQTQPEGNNLLFILYQHNFTFNHQNIISMSLSC